MQIWRENHSPDLGCPLLGSCVLVCVQLYSRLCSIQKAKGFKCEAIPYSSYFDSLDIDLLLYWWVTVAEVKTALVCAPNGAPDLRSLGTAQLPCSSMECSAQGLPFVQVKDGSIAPTAKFYSWEEILGLQLSPRIKNKEFGRGLHNLIYLQIICTTLFFGWLSITPA